MDSEVTEIDNKIISQLSYLDITAGSQLEEDYENNNKSVTVKQFLEYYKSYKNDPVLDTQLHDRFKGDEYEKWTNFINDKDGALTKYSDWKITNYVSNNKTGESGFVAYTFEPKEGQGVVAFRGSEPMTDIKYRNDWETNGSLLYTECTKQQNDVAEYMKGLGKYSDIVVTGHSLGGNLALYATVASTEEIRDRISDCSTFNGPGFNGEFLKEHKESIAEMNSRIHEYQNEYDITSSILYNLSAPIIIETTLKNDKATDFANHSLSSLSSDNNNNGMLNRSESQKKDSVCTVVHFASRSLEKLPKPFLKGATEVIFAVWNGRVDCKKLLAAAIVMTIASPVLSSIVAHGIISAVVKIVIVAVAIELLVDYIVPAVKDGIEFTVELAKKLYNETVSFMAKLVDDVIRDGILAGEAITGFMEMVNDDINDFFSGLDSFLKKNLGSSHQTNSYPKIYVNMDNLRNITYRLQVVQSKIAKLDRDLDTLRGLMDFDEKLPVLLIDLKMGFNNDLIRCIKYLNNATYELEQCERSIGQRAYAF